MSDCSTHAYDVPLKSCPFCGGENVKTSYKDTFSGDFRRGVYCADCSGGIYPYYDTEAEAIAAWNTRADDDWYCQACRAAQKRKLEEAQAKRTCEFVDDSDNEPSPPKCSACGYDPGIYECAWYEDGTYGYERNYCPNCGTKVIGG